MGVDGLISGAAVRYLRGDESGATAAASALMTRHPGKRRVLHTVVSLAALAGDAGLAQQASRALQVWAGLGWAVFAARCENFRTCFRVWEKETGELVCLRDARYAQRVRIFPGLFPTAPSASGRG